MDLALGPENRLASHRPDGLPKLEAHAGAGRWGWCPDGMLRTVRQPTSACEIAAEAAGLRGFPRFNGEPEADHSFPCVRVDPCSLRRGDGLPRLPNEPGCRSAESHAICV